MADTTQHSHSAGDMAGGGAHEHPSSLAHHFDTPVQQFDSGKLGMWLFLATEILFFGGLFCLYILYRAMHPEMFWAGHVWLDPFWGGINTAILIVSSFTMAWAVRAAQLSQKNLMVGLLGITFLCACGFMAVKAIEYYEKWDHGIGYGWFELTEKTKSKYGHGGHGAHDEAAAEHENGAAHPETGHADTAVAAADSGHAAAVDQATPPGSAAAEPAVSGAVPGTLDKLALGENLSVDQAAAIQGLEISLIPDSAAGPTGVVADTKPEKVDLGASARRDEVRIFFMIYFSMTGLHGIHVLGGMVAIGWLMLRGMRGDFNGSYYEPVDFVGLYWHLVDLIWIFLFPMLYLIH